MECVRSYLERLHQQNIKLTTEAIYFCTTFLYNLDSEMGRLMASMAEGRVVCGVLVGKPEGKYKLEDLSLGGRIILECIFKK